MTMYTLPQTFPPFMIFKGIKKCDNDGTFIFKIGISKNSIE